MSNFGRIKLAFSQARVSFITGSMFYGASLDRRPSALNHKKFISGPWTGDIKTGKELLVNIAGLLEQIENTDNVYANGFSWIRDLQIIGSSSVRKYIQTAVSSFINTSKKRKRFWTTKSWSIAVSSERITNWMFAYSFFAAGANDKFQKSVLASIMEQYSNINKIFKAEEKAIIRVVAIKAMIFCLSAMNSNHKSRILALLRELKTLEDCYTDLCPSDQFYFFKNLIETRFIAKNYGIDDHAISFTDELPKIASRIRNLRLGDGCMSLHQGWIERYSVFSSMFHAKSNIIDTALSTVDQYTHSNFAGESDLDRISTKKITLIVNTRSSTIRSRFSHPQNPGIGILDFESSFQTDRIISVSDIAILSDGWIKASIDDIKLRAEKDDSEKIVRRNYEVTNFNRFLQFAARREIAVDSLRNVLSVLDSLYVSQHAEIFIRIVFCSGANIVSASGSSAIISSDKDNYKFSINNGKIANLDLPFPTIIVSSEKLPPNSEFSVNWTLEYC